MSVLVDMDRIVFVGERDFASQCVTVFCYDVNKTINKQVMVMMMMRQLCDTQ